MKTKLRAILLVFLSMGILSNYAIAGNTKSDTDYITRDFQVTEFTRIEASTVGNITYTQSTDGKSTLKIYGREDIVELVKVELKDGVLKLGFEKQINMKSYKLKITLSSPNLNSIYFKGVGDILIENGLKTAKLEINSQGVGNVNIKSLTCDEVIIDSQGVGNVELDGTAKRAYLFSKGVGNIEAHDLVSAFVEASSKGVGHITCHATQTLEASVKGVGGIKYKGDPATRNIEKKGFGSVKAY